MSIQHLNVEANTNEMKKNQKLLRRTRKIPNVWNVNLANFILTKNELEEGIWGHLTTIYHIRQVIVNLN